MSADPIYLVAADAILIAHALFVAFVVLGVVAIYLGRIRSWKWVRNYWFRVLHLGAIVFVVLQSWVGAICPLTIWEMELRERSGGESYEGSFIQYWLESILYYQAPDSVFVVVYTAFGVLVVASWIIVPPKRRG